MPTLTDKQRAALRTLMSDDAIVGRLTLEATAGALYALTGDASGAHIDRGLSGVAVTLDVSAVARVLRVVLGEDLQRDDAARAAAEDWTWLSGQLHQERGGDSAGCAFHRSGGCPTMSCGSDRAVTDPGKYAGPAPCIREDRTEEEIDFAMTGDYGGRPIATDERDPVEVKIERDAVAERHRAEALAAKGAPGVVADPVRPAAPVSDLVMEHMRSCGARRGYPCDCADWEHPER